MEYSSFNSYFVVILSDTTFRLVSRWRSGRASDFDLAVMGSILGPGVIRHRLT